MFSEALKRVLVSLHNLFSTILNKICILLKCQNCSYLKDISTYSYLSHYQLLKNVRTTVNIKQES